MGFPAISSQVSPVGPWLTLLAPFQSMTSTSISGMSIYNEDFLNKIINSPLIHLFKRHLSSGKYQPIDIRILYSINSKGYFFPSVLKGELKILFFTEV